MYRALPLGPSLVLDQDLGVSGSGYTLPYGYGGTVYEPLSIVSDATGATHTLDYDNAYNSGDIQRALDGSGYTYVYNPSLEEGILPGSIYTSSGIQYAISNNLGEANGFYTYILSKTITDPTITGGSGSSSIQYSNAAAQSVNGVNYGQGCVFNTSVQYPGDDDQQGIYGYGVNPPSCINPGDITDSVGRIIPSILDIPISSSPSDLAKCPTNVGPANQIPTGVQFWTVPGPTATDSTGATTSTSTYIFCYTNVTYSTNFLGGWGYMQPPSNSETDNIYYYYADSMGTGQVIQSIVLPNKTYWGFVYDSIGAPPYMNGTSGAMNPCSTTPSNEACNSPSPVAYGDVMKIIRPSGGSTSYTYAPSIDAEYETCGLGTFVGVGGTWGFPPSTRMVQSRTVNDGMGNSSTWGYSWQASILNAASLSVTATVTNPTVGSMQSSTVHTFVDPTVGSSTASCTLPETLTQTLENGTVVGSSATQYTTTFLANNNVTQNLPHIVQESVDTGNGLTLVDTKTYGYSPLFSETMAYGSPVSVLFEQPTSVLTQGSDGSISDSLTTFQWQAPTTGFGQPWNYQYFLSPYENDLDAVAITCVTGSQPSSGCAPALAGGGAVTQILYGDGISLLNPWSIQQGLNGNWIGTKLMQHDSLGRVTFMQDANGNGTTISYGSSCSTPSGVCVFPSEIQYPSINGVAHNEYYSYDQNDGKVLSYTDENGSGPNDQAHTTNYTYDSVERLTDMKTPATHFGRGEVSRCYVDFGQSSSCPGGSTASTVYTTLLATPDPTLSSSQTYDGLGRPIKSFGTNGAESDTSYDALGRVSSVNNPHTSTPSTTDGTTYFTYDALGRKIKVLQPTGNTQWWCYNGLATDSQPNCNTHSGSFGSGWVDSLNEAGNDWQQSYDSLGRLRQVLEPGPLETDYNYDVLGNLQTATQQGVSGEVPHVRSFTYDSLSRIICAANPESSQNPCPSSASTSLPTGIVSYAYDGNGNLTGKTDARGVKALYTYDALNRLLGKCFTVSGSNSCATPDQFLTSSSCYQYDTATNGIGAVGASWTQAGSCASSLPATGAFTSRKVIEYDAMGGVRKEQQCTPGNCTTNSPQPFALSYEYDLAGNLKKRDDGIGQASWFHDYDSAGRLSGITATTVWPSSLYPTQLFSAQGFTPTGALTNWTLGNSNSIPALTGTRSYDSLRRPTAESVTGHD